MPKKPQPHPYADRISFERILLLIATFIQYPGIGSPDARTSSSSEKHHDALAAVQTQLRQVAAAIGINFPDGYPALATIRRK